MDTLKRFLRVVKKSHEKDFDNLIVITGMEGMGKSHLGLWVYQLWAEETSQEADVTFIALDQEQFAQALTKAQKRYGFVMYDEAGDGLLSRDAMADYNKDLLRLFMVIRQQGIFTVMILPNFWYLDKYFREVRLKALFHVYGRGKVAMWNKEQVENIIKFGSASRNIWAVKPSAYFSYPMYDGKLLTEYKQKKQAKVEASLADVLKKYSSKEGQLDDDERFMVEQARKGINHAVIAQALGVSRSAVSQRLISIRRRGIKLSKMPEVKDISNNNIDLNAKRLRLSGVVGE